MYLNRTFLAVIPARANSKRLPAKNMLSICGKPLIHWAIQAAKDSGIFDKIVLMSDSRKAREYAMDMGIYTYCEPEHLASDVVYVGDAIIDLLTSPCFSVLAKSDYVQLIEPTSPLIRPSMIRNAAEFLIRKDAEFVISMCEAEAPNGVAKPLPVDLCVTNWWPEELFAKRSQDCPTAYRTDGLIYVGKWDTWLQRNYWKSKIYAFITSKQDVLDINDINDFERAEAILEYRRKRKW